MKSQVAGLPARLLAILAALAVVATMLVIAAPAAYADQESERNQADFWESQYPNSVACYKYDPPDTDNAHGYLTEDGKSVVLNQYGATWPGDHWEVLVVKAGSSGGDDGYGNMIYEHPTAGVPYGAPDGKDVSHWIVCKGEDPEPEGGMLIVAKVIIDFDDADHAEMVFEFRSEDLEELFGDEEPVIVQVGHGDSGGTEVPAGTYEVSEINIPAGWSVSHITCDDSDSSGTEATATFVVADGETVTCTFYNQEDLPPSEPPPSSTTTTTTTSAPPPPRQASSISATTTTTTTVVVSQDEVLAEEVTPSTVADTLPFTGAESESTAAIAVMLLGTGVLFTLLSRIRREET